MGAEASIAPPGKIYTSPLANLPLILLLEIIYYSSCVMH